MRKEGDWDRSASNFDHTISNVGGLKTTILFNNLGGLHPKCGPSSSPCPLQLLRNQLLHQRQCTLPNLLLQPGLPVPARPASISTFLMHPKSTAPGLTEHMAVPSSRDTRPTQPGREWSGVFDASHCLAYGLGWGSCEEGCVKLVRKGGCDAFKYRDAGKLGEWEGRGRCE